MSGAFLCLTVFLLFIYFDPQYVSPLLAHIRAAFVAAAVGLGLAVVAGGRVPWSGVTKALLVLLVGSAVSTVSAIDVNQSLEALPLVLKSTALYALVALVLCTPAWLVRFTYVNVAFAALVGLTSLLATRAGILPLKSDADLYRMVNFFGGLGDDPNEFGAMMVTLLPLPAALAGAERGAVRRALLAALPLVFVLCITRSRSRGAFLALIVVGLLIFWRFRRSWPALLLCLAGVAYVAMNTHAGYWERLRTLSASSTLDEEYSAASRMRQQEYALDLLSMRPLVGVGPGNFVTAKLDLLRLDPLRKETLAAAHNSYLGLAAEVGLPGALALLAAIGVSLRSLRLASTRLAGRRADERVAAIAWGLRVGLVGLSIAIFFLTEQYNPLLYMWLAQAAAIDRLATAAGNGAHQAATASGIR